MKYWQAVKAVTQRIRLSRGEPAREAEAGACGREPPASEEWPLPGPAAELIIVPVTLEPWVPGKPPA
jgi:hypothetical protein